MKPKQKELVARFVAALEAYNENERRKMLASEAIAAALNKDKPQ
jgi:hypothetical protein